MECHIKKKKKKKLTQWNVNVDNQVFLQDDMNIKEANA